MKIHFIEWWLFDSGFSVAFFSKVYLDLVNSQLTKRSYLTPDSFTHP